MVRVLVDEARRRAVERAASRAWWLKAFIFVYGIFTALACMMLISVNVAPHSWGQKEYWWFFLTPFNIIVLGVFNLYSCDCKNSPGVVPIVIAIAHWLYCIVVLGFTCFTLANCAVTPWCTVPLTTKIDNAYLVWVIGFFGAIVVEAILVIVAAQLYAVQRRLCITPCQARGVGVTPGFGGAAGYGAAAGTGGGVGTGDFDSTDVSLESDMHNALVGLPVEVIVASSVPARQPVRQARSQGVTFEGGGGVMLGTDAIEALRATSGKRSDLLSKQH